ncbi:hypothetical protein ABZ820_05200 [Streptomyces diacarni]|uniref:hypothetical protein n=1 Tax=Streptomyces diacarni TaxID=2800381 RepID=UPI0033EDE8E8
MSIAAGSSRRSDSRAVIDAEAAVNHSRLHHEPNKTMQARGMKSPDRAEAVLLAFYEPEPLNQTRRRGLPN